MPWSVGDVDKHKKGLSDKGKRQWTRIANSVLTRCIAKGGTEETCAASAIKQANGSVGTNAGVYSTYKKQQMDYDVQIKVHQEKAHLIVPVVMMVEGVHNGSHGPLFHPISELGKFPAAWNGIPIVINHPEEDGHPISANSPEVIDKQTVGRVYNTNVDGSRLKAEAWIDEEKMFEIAPKMLADINANKEVEVSVGVFSEEEDVEGDWNGETYSAIARNHRPDHLALLTDEKGACSVEDGCGIRVNTYAAALWLKNRMKGYTVLELSANKEEGFKAKLDAAYNAISQMNTSESYYLEELFEDDLIYSKYTKEGTKMYRQGYKFESGKVELTGSPVEVHRQVEFVSNVSRTKFKKEDNMPKGNECPKCLEKINALIANQQSPFVEADREWLLTQDEGVLDKLAPVIVEKEKVVEKTIEINKLSPEDQADLAWARQMRKEKHEKLVQHIQANTEQGTWPLEELNGMSEATLERLAKSVGKKEAPVDYSLLGGNIPQIGNNVSALYPAGVEVDETKK